MQNRKRLMVLILAVVLAGLLVFEIQYGRKAEKKPDIENTAGNPVESEEGGGPTD